MFDLRRRQKQFLMPGAGDGCLVEIMYVVFSVRAERDVDVIWRPRRKHVIRCIKGEAAQHATCDLDQPDIDVSVNSSVRHHIATIEGQRRILQPLGGSGGADLLDLLARPIEPRELPEDACLTAAVYDGSSIGG